MPEGASTLEAVRLHRANPLTSIEQRALRSHRRSGRTDVAEEHDIELDRAIAPARYPPSADVDFVKNGVKGQRGDVPDLGRSVAKVDIGQKSDRKRSRPGWPAYAA